MKEHMMIWKPNHWRWLIGGVLGCAIILTLVWNTLPSALAQEADTKAFDAPTYSSPIALDAAKNLIWVVNPNDDSVSVIANLDANPQVIRKINVGAEPRAIALDTNTTDPTKYRAYVANAADNSVSIINITASSSSSVTAALETTLTTGAEPRNIASSPDGNRIYVANSGQDTITIIRTDTRTIIGHVNLRDSACNDPDRGRHFQPRGLAVTSNNDRLYVTRFLSFTAGATPKQSLDEGKEGLVCLLDIDTNATTLGGSVTNLTAITLEAQDTGFQATIGGAGTATKAYPNQLQSIVIRGNQAFLPNIAASPTGPLKFNVDTQAFVNVIDNAATGTPADASATKFLNLHLGARDPEPGKEKLFFANPWAIAFTTQSGAGNAYVVSASSDLLVKLNVDGNGNLDFTVDENTTRYIDLNDPLDPATSGAKAGKNPLGIVIRNIAPGNNKAFVVNHISRNVSVVDLDSDAVTQVIQTTALPPAGSQAEQLLVGAEVFFSSRGVFDQGKVNRLSSEGWQSCASCHPDGLTDSVIWRFGAGPRKSVPMNGTWSPHNPNDQRILNYSALFDELQDFELNIRNVSGPGLLSAGPPPVLDPNHGLLIGDDGNIDNAPAAVNAFALPNAGRPQLTVTLPGSGTAWPALDALKEWVRFAIRTPEGMLTDAELSGSTLSQSQVNTGRRLFFQAGCQKCHGGTKWTISNKDFTSPPDSAEIFTEAGAANAAGAQYLDRFLADIDSFNLGVAGESNPIGNNIGATEKANTANVADTDPAARDALGIDHDGDGKGAGYNIPSLLGIWALQPYYHNGACETLDCVLSNPTHRSAGRGGQDILNTQARRDAVAAFLQTLDADTNFPLNLYIDRHDISLDPPVVFRGNSVVVGANISLFGTRADLDGLFTDLGLTELDVEFTLTTRAGSETQIVPLAKDDFNQDFGQTVGADGLPIITATFNIPSNAGNGGRITIKVDSADDLPEDDEDDNEASRRFRIRREPPDKTPPVVNGVFISDDDPFNDNDSITISPEVRVKIVATDDNSGVNAFCIVHYTYDKVRRRWVEENCFFQPLPAPETGTTDTFIVDTSLQDRAGVAYAFVWVRDNSGNISRTPGFDVISFIPEEPISLNRNDTRVFRIRLTTAQTLTFTFDLESPESFGDVDVFVLDGFSSGANLIASSEENGQVNEEVTIAGPGDFQIEVDAIRNSRFSITFVETVTAVTTSTKTVLTQQSTIERPLPLVGGPPALRSAIDDIAVYLPLIIK